MLPRHAAGKPCFSLVLLQLGSLRGVGGQPETGTSVSLPETHTHTHVHADASLAPPGCVKSVATFTHCSSPPAGSLTGFVCTLPTPSFQEEAEIRKGWSQMCASAFSPGWGHPNPAHGTPAPPMSPRGTCQENTRAQRSVEGRRT